MGIVKGALVVGGIGLLANELTKNNGNRSANVKQTTTTAKPDSQAIAKAIREDAVLLASVRGEKGDAGSGYKASATNSTAIALGAKTFDVAANLAYSVGARVRITASSDVTKFMEGVVTAYTGTTLTVQVDTVSGTGSFASWNFNVAGERGAAGQVGPAGAIIQNYGGSLLKEGAFEYNSKGGWNAGVLEGMLNGLPVYKTNTANEVNTNVFAVNPKRLHRIIFNGKVDNGNLSIAFLNYDVSMSGSLKTTNNTAGYLSSTTFSEKSFFVGGIGSLNFNFHADCSRVKAYIYNTSTGYAYLNALTIKEVGLGEPVPYNLSYLPTGQMVYDPTTGEAGIFNGTTVIWFAS